MWCFKGKHISSFQIIILGFTFVIICGSLLLMLPIATRADGGAAFKDALFTAVSAVCVTGLVVQDTATYWSVFGQSVILLLIQIGGLGVITVAVSLTILSGRKIGLSQRSTMQNAISAPQVGGIVRLTTFILRTTVLIEGLGAVLLSPVFIRRYGVGKGIWYSIFHSISAFCNAGFDLMGINEKYSSLCSFSDMPYLNIVIMLLIISGGIGFLTWEDIYTKKFRISKYRMQSKVILSTTILLILVPAVYFFFGEFQDYAGLDRIFISFFQSVTTRTAGFNTVDLNLLSETGKMLMISLMIVGGSPGSTAGGMKNTTLAVLISSAFAVFKRQEEAHLFRRTIAVEVIQTAAAILIMYISFFGIGGMVISKIENLPMTTCMFETASAVGTVGLSLGITPKLGMVSRIILMGLMFFGRVGGLTLIFAAVSGNKKHNGRLPREKITVG